MDTPMLVRGNWSKARIFQPILRAYAIGYLSSTTPRVISYLRRLKDDRLSNKEKLEELIYFNLAARYPKITKDKLTFVAQLSRTLTNVIRLDSFPTFCALLVAGSTVLPVLLLRLCALVSSRIGKISGPVKSRVFLRFVRFVAAFVSAWFSFQLLNKKPIRQQGSDVISSHKTGSGANAGHSPEKKITPQYSPDLAGRTMDLTLFTFTRAMDALVCLGWSRWRASRRGQNRWSLVETVAPVLADTGLFAASSAVVMWAWFYLPERLPRSYGKWIGEVAKVDIRLIEALRRARRGIFVYGKETGQARLLESMCEDYKWPREWGDPSKTIPIPCEMVHMGCGPNCEKHAVWRFAKTFKFACATYIPLQVVFRVRSMKTMSSLWRALADALRSSTFLASFVSIFYYSVCLARTRIGPKIFSRETVTPQMWDSGLCVGAGCLMCGWSILVESARKRQEIALFVAPRAAATVLPRYYDKKTSGEWTTRLDELAERVIFLDSSRLDAREPTKLSDGTYSADDLCLDQCVSEDYEGPLDEDVDCVRRIPIDLRDEKCLHLVRGWTAECTARSTCSKTLAVKLPETIIEIPADPAVAPKLCSSNGRSGSYVILSYCSGDFEPSSQRESGNTGFSAPLDGPSLPKTLADAIEIARKLGYQYLWTRTLCASREEWGSDPARIAALYGQAALMLSAEAAKDPDSGIFHDRRVFYSPALGRNKDKYLRQQLLRWTTDIEESATAGRGSGQIRRCYVKGAVQPYIDRFLQDRVEEAGGVGGEVDVSKRVARLEAWHRCVDAFSKKSVDVTSDKLLVMAPLASAINDGTLGEYLAGIWSSDIAFGLGWSRPYGVLRPATEYRAPSWSWASVDGTVMSRALGWPQDLMWEHAKDPSWLDKYQLRLVSHHLNLADPQRPYGHVLDGSHILVEGSCVGLKTLTRNLSGHGLTLVLDQSQIFDCSCCIPRSADTQEADLDKFGSDIEHYFCMVIQGDAWREEEGWNPHRGFCDLLILKSLHEVEVLMRVGGLRISVGSLTDPHSEFDALPWERRKLRLA
ncbi:hypothetical protein CNMCM8812_008258 [Aspergillus fumigatus]|nr:hypothetical protein CNMCM8812_008258 [Aspergillus fumigatus]